MLIQGLVRQLLAAFAMVALPPTTIPATIANPTPFSVPKHETLTYQVEYRLVAAGRAQLDWYTSPILKEGYEAKLHLESTGLLSRLFHVNDNYTAQMDGGLCATSTFMTAREGSRSRDTKVTFDATHKKADYFERDLKTNGVVRHNIDIPPCVHDVLGGLYALRMMNLEPGHTAQIPISNGKKTAYLKVESQRREDIRVPVGLEKTVRYEIFAFDNQLYPRSGHLHVWLTDDDKKLPVQIEVRLQFTIGTVTLRLDKPAQG